MKWLALVIVLLCAGCETYTKPVPNQVVRVQEECQVAHLKPGSSIVFYQPETDSMSRVFCGRKY